MKGKNTVIKAFLQGANIEYKEPYGLPEQMTFTLNGHPVRITFSQRNYIKVSVTGFNIRRMRGQAEVIQYLEELR